MSSSFFAIFLSHTTLFIALGCGIIVLCTASTLLLWIRFSRIKSNFQAFMQGKNGIALEDVIVKHSAAIDTLDHDIQKIYDAMNDIRDLVRQSIYKKAVIRYNPFKDLGGDQSFAIALLDGDHSGFVLSSLHTRDGTRVYAKPIVHGTSEKYQLSDEEKTAILHAIDRKNA